MSPWPENPLKNNLRNEQARLAISQHYLARDDNPDLDPMRQEQLDRNRIPGQLGEQQVSPGPGVEARADAHPRPSSAGSSLPEAFIEALRDQPYRTLALAAGVGIVLGALWKSSTHDRCSH